MLKGHALAFAQSPVAKELLPELVELARSEAERDTAVCLRALAFEVGASSTPMMSDEDLILLAALGEELPGPSRPISDLETLGVLVGCLRSTDQGLREWALRRIPPDARALEAVVSDLTRSAVPARRDARGPEASLALRWLGAFASEQRALVAGDDTWKHVRTWGLGRYFLHPAKRTVPWPSEATAKLTEWLEKNRAKLPEQVK